MWVAVVGGGGPHRESPTRAEEMCGCGVEGGDGGEPVGGHGAGYEVDGGGGDGLIGWREGDLVEGLGGADGVGDGIAGLGAAGGCFGG